jgi:hypothetical protein
MLSGRTGQLHPAAGPPSYVNAVARGVTDRGT